MARPCPLPSEKAASNFAVLPAVADPPAVGGDGPSCSSGPEVGGDLRATPINLELGNAWQMVAGTDCDENGQIGDLEHLEALLESSPDVAGPMLMGALVRLRAALQQIPRTADAMQEVCIPAADAVLLSRSVLRGLR